MKTLCFLILLAWCAGATAQPVLVYHNGDHITENGGQAPRVLTWTSGTQVYVEGEVRIGSNSLLLIDPGVTITFRDNSDPNHPNPPGTEYGIRVQGLLKARGSTAGHIAFNCQSEVLYEFTTGIRLDNPFYMPQEGVTWDTTEVQYCDFENIWTCVSDGVSAGLGRHHLVVTDSHLDCWEHGITIGLLPQATVRVFRTVFNFRASGATGISVGIEGSYETGPFWIENCAFHHDDVCGDQCGKGIYLPSTFRYSDGARIGNNVFVGLGSGLHFVENPIFVSANPEVLNNVFLDCAASVYQVEDIARPLFVCNNYFRGNTDLWEDNQDNPGNLIDPSAVAENNEWDNEETGPYPFHGSTLHLEVFNTSIEGYQNPLIDADFWLVDRSGLPARYDANGGVSDIGVFAGPNACVESTYVVIPTPTTSDIWLASFVDNNVYRVRGAWRLSGDVNFMSGWTFSFDTGASFELVTAECDGYGTCFEGFGTALWRGVECRAGTSLTLSSCSISDAGIGVRAVGANLDLTDVTVRQCGTGVKIEECAGDATDVSLSNVMVANCGTGIAMIGSSGVTLNRVTASDNVSTGIVAIASSFSCIDGAVTDNQLSSIQLFARSSAELDCCRVAGNGRGFLGGGGIRVHDSELGLLCCTVTENRGPGVWQNGSSSSLHLNAFGLDSPRGGNEISDNAWNGQIEVLSGAAQIANGRNRICSIRWPKSRLVTYLPESPSPVPSVNANGNFWCCADAGRETDIANRLYPTTHFLLTEYDRSWDRCGAELPIDNTDCDSLLNCAQALIKQGQYSSASAILKTLIVDYQGCDFAQLAAEKLGLAEQLSGASLSAVRDTLLLLLAEVDSTELKFALAKAAAEAAAFDHDFETALDELDSLKDVVPEQLDSIAVMYSSYAVNYLQAVNDTTDTLGHAVHYDTLMAHYDALMEFQFAGEVFKPTLEHTPPDPISAADDEVTLAAEAFAEDSVHIHQVLVDYRFWPSGSWEHDTLTHTSGDSYVIDLELAELGGGLEYRLLTIDSSGRVEAWPSTEGYPDLNDTLTHFVSFEPRVETLSDTAYIYAPGVLTRTIMVQDDGVLYVLPSPQDEAHVLAADSGVGMMLDFAGTGDRPQLLVQGTADDTITITKADPTDRWAGIQSAGGLVDCRYAVLQSSSSPLAVDTGDSPPVVRFEHCRIADFAQPVAITGTAASGADSSVFNDVRIDGSDDAGLEVSDGTLVMNAVTIRECAGTGLSLSATDGLAASDLMISGNGGTGLALAAGSSYAVRLTRSTISFNGDTLPEVTIAGGLLDLSAGAGNVLKDSSGVLISAVSEDGIDLELGSNTFQILDTLGGSYLELDVNTGGAYITGNFFGPVHVNDFTFVTDYLVPDTANGWIYTYLRNASQMDEVVASPGDSLEFMTKAYLENFVGQVPGDSILEVGFKFKVLPDSANWTTKRLYGKDADSLYNWWVKVGDDGGLVNYVFWAKDSHGRFVTSPAGADTTDPANGPSHHTSFELNRTTINGDSVTIWAPTVLTHNIDLGAYGRLVIKPWPGATDHTVTFAEGVYIELAEYGAQAPHLWIEGTEAMPIRLASEADTTDWDQIYIGGGTLTATYTTFEGGTYTLQALGAELELDHCEFANSESFLYVEATGYVRNCVFRNMGEEYGFGSVAFGTGAIEVSDCWFYQNDGVGLYLYDHDGSVSGSNFMANTLGGLYGEDYLTNEVLSCSEFSYNGGDSTAEVTVNASTLHFADGAACVFADHAGPLLSGTAMSSFDLAGGGNGFYLFDSSGTYITTGDETDTLNISGNYWYPFSPDTSVFWPLMDPDTSRFWQMDSTAEEVAECGGGSAAGMHTDRPQVVRPGSGDGATTGFHENGATAISLGRVNSKSAPTQRNSAAMASLKQADVARGNGDYTRAALLYRQFINEHPDHTLMVPALVGYFSSAKRAGSTNGLSAFFAEAATKLPTVPGRQAAHELSLKALVLEGQPQAALNGYERLLETATNRRDSVRAVIATMDIQLHHGQREQLLSAHPENNVTTFKEFARRAMALSAMVVHDRDGALDDPVVAAPVPTEYRLYQNFPNPFNPNTEIRFDLPEAMQVQLRIFNILGQEVTTLVDELKPAGAYNLRWDSKNAAGSVVASGVYVYQLKAGKFVDQKKMVLIR